MSESFSTGKAKRPDLDLFVVKEGKNGKNHWSKVGAAWKTKDDGLNIVFDSIPVNGKAVGLTQEKLEKMRAERQAKSQSQKPAISPQP